MSEEKKPLRMAVIGGFGRAHMMAAAIEAAARDGLIEVVHRPISGEMRASPRHEPMLVVDEVAAIRRAAWDRLKAASEPPLMVRTPLTAHDQERLRLAEIKRARKAQKLRRDQR